MKNKIIFLVIGIFLVLSAGLTYSALEGEKKDKEIELSKKADDFIKEKKLDPSYDIEYTDDEYRFKLISNSSWKLGDWTKWMPRHYGSCLSNSTDHNILTCENWGNLTYSVKEIEDMAVEWGVNQLEHYAEVDEKRKLENENPEDVIRVYGKLKVKEK